MSDATFNAFVHTLAFETEDITRIELRPVGVAPFPAFEAGAHIDLHLPNGLLRSYSLLNAQDEQHRYVLGVLKDRASRGGSRCVHEQLRVGMKLVISAPRNNFKLHEDAGHSVLIAGGIGVTPLLSMGQRLRALGRSFEIFYFARSRSSAAFLAEIQALGAAVHLHFDDEQGQPPDLAALLSTTPGVGSAPGSAGTHYYACGPAPMLDSFEAACAALGLHQAHVERFAAVEVAAANDARQSYSVELRRSGKTLQVTPGQSLLAALRAAKVEPATSCEEGICGCCETSVLEGTPDHRDSVLSSAERAANKVMMVCVSGCKSERLVLDL
jgi:ferredoxin-NADP reductase